MTETKLCKDCRHCLPEVVPSPIGHFKNDYGAAKCDRTTKVGREYVDGQRDFWTCVVERTDELGCGPTAKFFEPI